MSGFALIFNRDGEPASPDILGDMLARLAHRGPDGRDVLLAGNVGLGHLHFWVTPEDVGARQPLSDPSGRFHIVFDGRVDNRAEVLAGLGLGGAENGALPDAEIVLRAYLRWGDACFERLLGPLAAAIVDGVEQRVVLARDALGSRTLYYFLNKRVLVAASEPYALLAHPAISPELSESTVVRWYAVMAPKMGTTLFADVSEVYPAHAMAVGTDEVRQWRHWDVDPAQRLRYRSDDEYAEHFLHLLRESVHCCLRSSTPVAVSMSGGYDSTSVAALAALELASRPEPERLLAFSWIFDELTDCDERLAIEAMNRHFDTLATHVPGDDAWPLRDWEAWPHNPNMPEGNPYRLLKMRLYRAASAAGARVLLTGGHGNEILGGSDYWLVELLRDGRLGAALTGLIGHVRRRGMRQSFTQSSLIRVGGWLLDAIPGGRRIRPKRRPLPPGWLTPHARDVLAQELPDTWPPSAAESARPGHHVVMFGTYTTTGAVLEMISSNQAGIDLRHPYQDRRLVEFAMTLPAYMMYNGCWKKPIVYKAMAGILPETVRRRQSSGLLGSLYKRGLLERERSVLARLLEGSDTIWQRYIEPGVIWRELERLPTAPDGPRLLIPWRCAAMEMWRIKVRSLSPVASSQVSTLA